MRVGKRRGNRESNSIDDVSLTFPAPRILESCIKSLHKTFWGTTKKCENKNLS